MNENGKYYAVPLHMHSCFEGHASMRGHMYQAQKLGMEYIWITDHDFLMGKSENWVDGFSFAEGTLIQVEEEAETNKKIEEMYELFMPFGTVIDPEKEEDIYNSIAANLRNVKSFQLNENKLNCILSITENNHMQKCMKMSARAEEGAYWKKSVIEFTAGGSRMQYNYNCSLLSDVTVRFPFELLCEIDENIRISFCASFSQQHPEYHNAGIKYVLGNIKPSESDLIPEISLEFSNGEEVCLKLSKDAEKYVRGGLDNAFWRFFIEIELRNGKQFEAYMGDLHIERKYEYEEVLKRQRKLAAQIGKEYGVTPIVTNEISAAGQHKISFCTKVPVIDYCDGPKSHHYAVEWVKKHGGIFSLNHPYFDWKRVPAKEEERAVIIENLAKHYIQNVCWGASMLEVGFPLGRENFAYQDYLTLWDKLSLAGIFISGYGDSDNHYNLSGWFEGNNFCAYLYSENPCEDSFIEAMKCGNLYTADPVQFHGRLSFESSDGAKMGQVVEISKETSEKKVCLKITNAPKHAKLVWVINGLRQREITLTTEVHEPLQVLLDRDINFVRAELYVFDRCVMLTNPIYFVKEGCVKIPAKRKVLYDRETNYE